MGGVAAVSAATSKPNSDIFAGCLGSSVSQSAADSSAGGENCIADRSIASATGSTGSVDGGGSVAAKRASIVVKSPPLRERAELQQPERLVQAKSVWSHRRKALLQPKPLAPTPRSLARNCGPSSSGSGACAMTGAGGDCFSRCRRDRRLFGDLDR